MPFFHHFQLWFIVNIVNVALGLMGNPMSQHRSGDVGPIFILCVFHMVKMLHRHFVNEGIVAKVIMVVSCFASQDAVC